MKSICNSLLVLFLVVFFLPAHSFAVAPSTINYQGYLTDSGGAPVTSTVSIVASMYPTPAGGVPLWSELHLGVPVDKGLFSIELGSIQPLSLSQFNGPLFIGIIVNGGNEMQPRQPLSSVAYSLRSSLADQVADGSISAAALAPGSVTTAALAPGSVTGEMLGISCPDGALLVKSASGWACGSTIAGTGCSQGDFISCYDADAATIGVGLCKTGIRSCSAGLFAACTGAVTPVTEVCDGVDNDCDGTIDVGASDAPIWYANADGDAYGDASISLTQCDQPAGYIQAAGDCDDTSSTVYPGALERCDGIDNDCNGLVDDSCSNRVCTDQDLGVIQSCMDSSAGDSNLLLQCLQSAGLSADCFNASFTLSLCDIGAGCNQSDLLCLATNCRVEYEAVYGECTIGQTRACGSAAGACQQGTQSCDVSGLWELTCTGSVGPASEICDGLDNDCDGLIDEGTTSSWLIDADVDGFGFMDLAALPQQIAACVNGAYVHPPGSIVVIGGSQQFDCNDFDPNINPGAAEICDGQDTNCDGVIDNGAPGSTQWYFDSDGDGFGDPESRAWGCTAPPGSVADGSDCDDGDPTVYPGGVEICDGLDNDCNAQIDEGAIGPMWYADNDGDGFGDSTGIAVQACYGLEPVGYIEDNTDCDDTLTTVYPGAIEICDGLDNNCDGQIDENGAMGPMWFIDWDGDGFGDSTNFVNSCSQPVGYVADDTDCDDVQPTVYPGAVEICDGLDNDCNGGVDEVNCTGLPAGSDCFNNGQCLSGACSPQSGQCL